MNSPNGSPFGLPLESGMCACIFRNGNRLSNHSFKVGQNVLYTGISGRGAASGVYRVTQLLPSEDDDCRYRIKSADEPYERVVKESEISGS